ncbi:MAG: hypothetical protein OEO20_14445 [Gemmatimonadota bacterium]|nr:hypothetical protein [Gemmatimonadota bacterium]
MRWPGFLLLPLLFVACTDTQPLAPIEDGPVFNWMNNPDNGNLQINRFMDHFAVSWTDPRNGLRATHTTYPIEDEPDCGPQELLDDLVDYQDVGVYEDDILVSWLRSVYDGADLWLIIRDETQAGDCYGNLLIGQGTTRIHGTDNDVFAWYEGSTRMNNNSYGWTAHGELTTVGGEVLDYQGVYRDVWDPQTGMPIHTTAKVTLR